MNEWYFGTYIIAIGITTGLVYLPINPILNRDIVARLQVICIASLFMIWSSIGLGYIIDGKNYFIAVIGIVLSIQVLVQAYTEPYKHK